MDDLRRQRILILLRSLIETTPDPKLPSFYAHAKRGPEPTAWIDCRAGCKVGIVRDHGRIRLCSRCGGRGCELIDPYLEEWMGDVATDTVKFFSRLDTRRHLDREIGRLRQLERVRAGLEATTDSLIAAVERSEAWGRHGSYPELRNALERLSARLPVAAHVLAWTEVYSIQANPSHIANLYKEMGLQMISRWMPDQIRVPSWLEPPREERLFVVGDMLRNGWKTRRIARHLKISQAKAKRLARASARAA